MSDAAPSGREYGRVVFVLGCVLALVLAAALLPGLIAPIQGTPAESLLPTHGSSTAGLGALSPGNSTDVGSLGGEEGAGLRSLNAETHFVVESTEAAYWRTGAYDTYTGRGWARSGETTDYTGSIGTDGLVDRTVSYQVELNRSATALPTVWRPQTVDADTAVSVTDQRAVVTTSNALTPGTTYTATSARPPRNPDTLSAAGRDYPDPIAERYTQLPDWTPGRLERFTDDLTSDADSPYETAIRIERWLETNKSYSLNATGPDSDTVASDFVFEMDEGYCEYFATSMVAMLRTQDIPARYVVGYSTGQETGENTYRVRGMNAHAWVEVYFPDVGWVRFDPTPGEERLRTEQVALQRQQPDAGEYNHTEEGSPGETFAASATGQTIAGGQSSADLDNVPDSLSGLLDSTAAPDRSVDDVSRPRGDFGNSSGQLNVSLSDRPVPGETVTVRVERGGSPAFGVTVLFNGEPIGETGLVGTVEGTVPYESRLHVTVRARQSRTTEAIGAPPADVVGDDRQYAVRPPSLAAATENVTAGGRTYDVPTNATLSLSGRVATGQTVTLTATIAGTAIPNATVRLDGARVGTTNGDGRLDVTLPDEPGLAVLAVRRGAVAGNHTVDLAALRLDVDPRLPIALPWSGVTVTAELGNETLAGVPVSINGEQVGTTGIDGTFTPSLPLTDSVRLSIAAVGQRDTATVDGLLTNLVLVGGTLVTLVAGVVAMRHRNGIRPGAALDRLVDGIIALPRWSLAALVAAADALVQVGLWAIGSIRRGLATLQAYLARDLSRDALLAAFRAWLGETTAGARSVVEPFRTTASEPEQDRDSHSEARVTIRDAWGRFLGRVSVRDPATKTPGELAAHAVERDGLPAEAVATLRDAFRAVEYGACSPDDRLQDVQSAIERLESRPEGED